MIEELCNSMFQSYTSLYCSFFHTFSNTVKMLLYQCIYLKNRCENSMRQICM
ncbi:hypothetical protein Mapa_007096 [Marchantia paleacea]|nr:hypothetical protein Mapa_007096 [Marchantia paleacea]